MFAWVDECDRGGEKGTSAGGGGAASQGRGGDGRVCKKHTEPCAFFEVKKEVRIFGVLAVIPSYRTPSIVGQARRNRSDKDQAPDAATQEEGRRGGVDFSSPPPVIMVVVFVVVFTIFR